MTHCKNNKQEKKVPNLQPDPVSREGISQYS